jgi:acetyl-CoA carboxylase biotin carboxyl carrier protein
MDPERIKAIIELSKASGACEVAVETANGSVRVRRRPRVAQPAAALAQPPEGQGPREVEATAQGHVVRAANVGWFHRGPRPDTEPFVQIGDHVAADRPLGTIETLKMSNQVVTEVSGEVREILVEEGVEVEYGQPLFVIEPDTK